MAPGETYIEARVAVTREQVAAVEALMESQGAVAVTLSDVADVPVLEPGVGETPLWPEVEVCGLYPSATSKVDLKAVLSLAPGVESADRVHVSALVTKDWVTAWRDQFGPMQFGPTLWIVPTEDEPPDPHATLIRLDPGLAFGTGTHPSTRLCLEWIETTDLVGKRVIDFGCGTGVLGIAAALRGAREVLCVDNDPQAVLAAAENARRNGVADRLQAISAEDYDGSEADVLLANILAGILIDLYPVLGKAVRPGGHLVMAGILAAQAEAVATRYRARYPDLRSAALDEWVRLCGRAEQRSDE